MSCSVVVVREEDGRYSVRVPDLPGCRTLGASLPEALRSAEEAIASAVEAMRERGELVSEEVAQLLADLGDLLGPAGPLTDDEYDREVDAGLLEATRAAMSDPDNGDPMPWEQVKRALRL